MNKNNILIKHFFNNDEAKRFLYVISIQFLMEHCCFSLAWNKYLHFHITQLWIKDYSYCNCCDDKENPKRTRKCHKIYLVHHSPRPCVHKSNSERQTAGATFSGVTFHCFHVGPVWFGFSSATSQTPFPQRWWLESVTETQNQIPRLAGTSTTWHWQANQVWERIKIVSCCGRHSSPRRAQLLECTNFNKVSVLQSSKTSRTIIKHTYPAGFTINLSLPSFNLLKPAIIQSVIHKQRAVTGHESSARAQLGGFLFRIANDSLLKKRKFATCRLNNGRL